MATPTLFIAPDLGIAPQENSEASSIVSSGFSNAQSYVASSVATANGFMTSLEDIARTVEDIPDISEEIGALESSIRELVLPTEPERPGDFDFSPQPEPAQPTLDDVTLPSLPDAPVFTGTRPSVDFDAIDKPAALDANVPSAPDQFDVNLPADPEYTLPDVPSMITLSLPGEPQLDLPSFTATAPVVPDSPSVPTFTFTEPEYVSSLLTSLQNQLETWVNGAATGLDPDVEQAIFDRGRARENAQARREELEIRRAFSNRGHNMPVGAMGIALQQAFQNASNKSSEINRDIMIAQADLEQKNRQFAMTTSVQIQGALLQYQNGIATRAYEAARASVDTAINLYQLIITRYNAQVQAYNVQTQVFRELVTAALAKLDIYRAQLEGQKIIGELNRVQADIYTSRLQGVLAVIEAYKSKVDAARVVSEVNNVRVQAFGREVDAYRSQVDAKTSEYDAYAKEIQAEAQKLESYRVDAQAYQSEVAGYEALVRGKTAASELEAKVKQEYPLLKFRELVNVFQSRVTAESERIRALASVYNTDVGAFSAITTAKAQQVQADTTKYQAESNKVIEEARLRLTALNANVQKLLSSVDILKDIAKSGGIIASQLAASALSMVNLSAGISSQESNSYSSQESVSQSVSWQSSVSESYSY